MAPCGRCEDFTYSASRPQRPIAVRQALNILLLSRHGGHGQTCRRPDPLAIEPSSDLAHFPCDAQWNSSGSGLLQCRPISKTQFRLCSRSGSSFISRDFERYVTVSSATVRFCSATDTRQAIPLSTFSPWSKCCDCYQGQRPRSAGAIMLPKHLKQVRPTPTGRRPRANWKQAVQRRDPQQRFARTLDLRRVRNHFRFLVLVRSHMKDGGW
jgi:hypothetical protein